MTGRRGQQGYDPSTRASDGFSVDPVRLSSGGAGDPGRSRRPGSRRLGRLPILAAIAISGSIVVVALLGPRLSNRPELDLSFLPTPSPTPSVSPSATPFSADPALSTPLPSITFGDGPHPSGTLVLDLGDGLRPLDLATGTLGTPTDIRQYEDAVFRTTNGGWACICFRRLRGADTETVSVQLAGLDRDGIESDHSRLEDVESSGVINGEVAGAQFDVDLGPGREVAYVAAGLFQKSSWTLRLDAIDLVRQRVMATSLVASLRAPEADPAAPSPSIPIGGDPDQVYANGPAIRVSPDGRHLIVWGWIERYSPSNETQTATPTAWMVDLDPANPVAPFGAAKPIAPALLDIIRACGWLAFADPDQLVAGCQGSDPNAGPGLFDVKVFGLDGGLVRQVRVEVADESYPELIVDRTHGQLWTWDPNAHRLGRIDLRTGRADTLTVDPATPAGNIAGAPAGRPGEPTEWIGSGSAMGSFSGSIVGAPNGTRLYTIGFKPEVGDQGRRPRGSTGIWVFDAASLTLIDHWTPVTAYGSLSVSRDGEWIVASGMPGIDAEGLAANWWGSLSFHRIQTGQVGLRAVVGNQEMQWIAPPP